MKFTGKINKINHIVLSDPSYEKGVWCRYEKEKLNEKDWLVNLDIHPEETKLDNFVVKGIEFTLLLQKEKKDCELDGKGNLRYSSNIELKDFEIGMDTACVALGINNNANEIIKAKDEWQPSCAIRTGTDGVFGEVVEGTRDGSLCFLLISGYFDADFINENEVFDYLKNQFEITELIKEDITLDGSNRKLNVGDKVEVSSCSIRNDVGGTTIIRNSNYKNELDGMNITVENPDGSIEHTTLKSHDKITDISLEIEVLDSFYDYETGYHYKGKVTNENLIEELRAFGTTGFTPDDYKKYKNKSIYEDTLKASKEFDPSVIHFSEFDVVKVLEKDTNKEMEMC